MTSAETYPIKKKLPGLSYAFTLNGIELPALDVTHPDFISSINEERLKKLVPYVEKNADKNAKKFNQMPAFIKRYFSKHSFAMAELLQNENESAFASGISTLMMKLGPELIGKGRKRYLDRKVSQGFGSLLLRMRARDISHCLASSVIPELIQSPGKNLCFINIAGGAASDSINALFLILQKDPSLLVNRKIEINVLDIDDYGPAFAGRCIDALKAPGGKFNGLDVNLRHVRYDWNQTEEFAELLNDRKDWLQICSSEGGLFEYCTDDVIIQNLDTLRDHSAGDIAVAGSLLHDFDSVDAGIKAALKISTNIKPRFLGIDGLKKIADEHGWKVNNVMEGNPRYVVFSMSKKRRA